MRGRISDWLVRCINIPCPGSAPAGRPLGRTIFEPPTKNRTRAKAPLLCLWLALQLFAGVRPYQQTVSGQQEQAPSPMNRLAREPSPYLRAHAHNPVDWYPWGEEALARAKRENKVIFLSIGYSSCHWCHVMERESFQDKEIADLLNEHFICIKVDREQRPDVDHVYMTALQVFYRVTGSGSGGGWPLTMFLTPEAEPFFGGTYFPPRDGQRGFNAGLLTILRRVHEVWTKQEAQVRQDARLLTRVTRGQLEAGLLAVDKNHPRDTDGWRALWDSVETALYHQFDPTYGGFGFDPASRDSAKFPEPPNLFYLIDRIERLQAEEKNVERSRQMLETTLTHMALGGIRDHLGGGFHRYSVDRSWRIPHFEKMLYDNAQLLSVYSRAYAMTQKALYRQAAEDIADFMLREFRHEAGGFYSALDAESQQEEGRYYLWELEEIKRLLEPDELLAFTVAYQLDRPPQLEDRWYVLQIRGPLEDIARQANLPADQLALRLAAARKKLHAARQHRVRPLCDTKLLASWNGMAIAGLVDAAVALSRPDYLDAALQAAEFIEQKMISEDGQLKHGIYEGQDLLPSYLDDYAFVTDAFLTLHQTTGAKKWLDRAVRLQRTQDRLFWDEAGRSYFFTSQHHETLLARAKIWTDNVFASGNAKSALNLVRLARWTGEPAWARRAEHLLQAGWTWLDQTPAAVPELARAVAHHYLPVPGMAKGSGM